MIGNRIKHNFPLLYLLGYLLVVQSAVMDINDFFPGINGNLTKITWAHAVNDKAYLNSALNSSVMMLEADVVYGKVNGSGDSVPIMGHPPATESDLSLEDFLKSTYNFNKDEKNLPNRKGVKLDFKSTEVFNKSISLIEQLYNSIDYPIWINADIIRGPLIPLTVPVDANTFLSNSKVFNKSVLSLGWTTTAPSTYTLYTDEQISKMVEAIKSNNVEQDITFAVRAGIAALSLDQMKALKAVNNCTLTIWSSEGDNVDVPKLRDVIFEYGIKRVYVDVPQDLYDSLDLGSLGTGTGTFPVNPWLVLAGMLSTFYRRQ